jgi:hypothetical protein
MLLTEHRSARSEEAERLVVGAQAVSFHRDAAEREPRLYGRRSLGSVAD